jgi:hypothetical protein
MTTRTPVRVGIPRLVEHGGKLYAYYAGPYKSAERAYDLIEQCFADGRFSTNDLPIVCHAAVYIVY